MVLLLAVLAMQRVNAQDDRPWEVALYDGEQIIIADLAAGMCCVEMENPLGNGLLDTFAQGVIVLQRPKLGASVTSEIVPVVLTA
ncbi:MAG: hypothetical protein D6737_05740 [Chloroflexi bacterium]|nr:MAG: hypothetical protein D6737_05740 [Chloroflexota bacterium]